MPLVVKIILRVMNEDQIEEKENDEYVCLS